MTRVYYKEAVGCFIVFDVTRQSTFDAVAKWKYDLDTKVQLANGQPIPCLLLANKVYQLFISYQMWNQVAAHLYVLTSTEIGPNVYINVLFIYVSLC